MLEYGRPESRPVLTEFALDETDSDPEPVIFVETIAVAPGVQCDTYIFPNDSSKDLGIVSVEPGFRTPVQKVVSGITTVEGYVGGSGTLEIVTPEGSVIPYEFGPDLRNNPILVQVGETMQWTASDEGLIFSELCEPPYQDGRYQIIGPEPTDASKLFNSLTFPLSDIPEIRPAIELANSDPGYVADIYAEYVDIIRQLSNLDYAEQDLIQRSWAKLIANGGEIGSASQISAIELLARLSDSQILRPGYEAAKAITPESEQRNAAVSDLATMLEAGHWRAIEGKQLTDGDPEADVVIWGHTEISDPDALVHFVICHFLERYFARLIVSTSSDPKLPQKDFFINAMADVILLDHFGLNHYIEIFEMWATPKDQGGLGWLKLDRIDSFAG